MTSEIQQRADATLDPLTGLLNRKALAVRFAEIAEQAAVTEGWVSVIECDLDHFKDVNDEYGHDRGDAVLKDAAYALRKNMRSFELVYRLGGEEFLIVLPGVAGAEAAATAERGAIGDRAGAPRRPAGDRIPGARHGARLAGAVRRPLPACRLGALRGQAQRSQSRRLLGVGRR